MSDEELLSIDGVEKQTRKYGDAFIKAIIEFQRQKLLKKKEANLPRNVRNVRLWFIKVLKKEKENDWAPLCLI
jgi:hypothetical protein